MSKQLNTLVTPTNPRDNFTIVSNKIIFDKNLSAKARLLLIFMLALPPGWNFTEKGLATASGEGIKSVRSGLKELMDAKYMYRVQSRNDKGNGFGSMTYYLFTEPTDMQVNGDPLENNAEASAEELTYKPVNKKPEVTPVINVDDSNPYFDYLNGGWMLED